MSKPKPIQWSANKPAEANARRELPVLVAAYFKQVRDTLANNPKARELHALRLRTKRLRYTLEVFRPCYGPGLRDRIASLRRVQQCLGEVNDCVTARAVVAGFSKKNSVLRRKFEDFLHDRSLAKAEEFRRLWTERFDAPGRERWWTGYLARHAHRPGRK